MALASLVDWRADTWAAMLRHDSEIFGVFKCCMSPPALEDLPMSGWIMGVWGMTGVYGSIIVAWKKSLQAVVLSDSSAHSDNDLGIVTPLVEPQVDSPSGPWCTKGPNAGKGGTASQLRKFVIPDGELENIMAPSPVKKRTCKKGQKTAVPAVQTPDRSDGAGSAPTLHVGENGERFGLQKNPIPPGYVGLQPLGWEHPSTIPRPKPSDLVLSQNMKKPNITATRICLRHTDENQDIDHTQCHQGQAERWVGRPVHASQKDYGRNRREDPGKQSQPQARSNAIVEVVHHIHQPNVDYDVIKWHQKTDCRAHSPSPTHLHSVCYSGFTVNQPKTKCAHTSNLQSNNDCQAAGDSGDMKVDTDLEVRHTSVGCCMKAAKNLWVKLLNYTKACFRLHLSITDPFPTCDEALSDTGICLELITESIVAWEAQNRRIEADFYPQYEYDMATVIYNDSINFHSRIKQITINVVPVEYKLCSSKTFYDGGLKYLRQFPEFHHTIPRKALLLVTTIVHNVIHIYSMYGHVNTKQTTLGDSEKVYWKLTNMLKQVTDDECHCEKLDDKLQSWAVAGMTRVVVDGKPQGIESDSNWVVKLN
ncbi:uncharacterized protein EDB91DRAFT_1084418 [Suillus paluster]|uniref:uncharacterized protein n=1 Tax=Suillus paluster TaxID=48578 RepID=UPI001B885F7C|nr:uncharacterized protein EDB91DRAFT_1084418 [Suillus paluster]KAG1733359.1 hypothetical protein EDB91DRAFT_1084418 [Suillus paluster]